MQKQTYTQTIESFSHIPESIKDQAIAAYDIETVNHAALIHDMELLNQKLKQFNEKEQKILQEMSIFTQQMERKIIVLERNDTETKERNYFFLFNYVFTHQYQFIYALK